MCGGGGYLILVEHEYLNLQKSNVISVTPLYFRSLKGHVNFYHINFATHDGDFLSSLLELDGSLGITSIHTPFSENAHCPPTTFTLVNAALLATAGWLGSR